MGFPCEEEPVSTAIITDSTSDIPDDQQRNFQIFQIPALLIINGTEMIDGLDITREDFYRLLPGLPIQPTTAAPSVGSFQQIYQTIFQKGFTKIISIHAASRLSGIFNAARIAARDFGDRILVLDSQQLSLGLGFQVISAAKGALDNLDFNLIHEKILDVQKRVRVFALLDTLEYIHRSGRVSWAKARLGSLLNIKPFIELTRGEVQQLGFSRSGKNGRSRLMKILIELGPLEYLAILHTNALEEAKTFLSEYPLSPPCETILVNVTTVIGTHVGPGGLGFAAVVK